jgi:nucleoside 2-deoxyribosyltransferase
MLRWAVAHLPFQDDEKDYFQPARAFLRCASYSRNDREALRLAEVLNVDGLVVPVSVKSGLSMLPSNRWRVTARGHLRAEAEEAAHAASLVGFTAMSFAPEMLDFWGNGFAPGIADAGYEPLRVDQVEHLGKIDDEILNQIRKARFVVADFTGHRAGVYFEAGYALGLGLPVVWTCRETDISRLHFDIRQYNCIAWNSVDDLRRRLRHRIEAAIGEGPRKARL